MNAVPSSVTVAFRGGEGSDGSDIEGDHMPQLTVTRNDVDHRYEGRLGDTVAFIAFRLREDVDPPVVVMTHTEVPEEMSGEGVGSQLVRQALDDVRRRGEKLLPLCPFVASWLAKHPDYQDLVGPAS